VTPISNRLKAGEEPIVVVVGEGADGNTDLFAAPAGGGPFHQLTFNRAVEDLPKLSPSGVLLAYVRRTPDHSELVVFDLTTGGERTAPIVGEARRLGWSPGGEAVVVATASGPSVAALAGEPFQLTPGDPATDSLTYERLGTPAFAAIRACRSGTGICVLAATGEETALGADVTDGCRWGSRAVAYVRAGKIEVRPLGGGRVRQPTWSGGPANLRRPTHHPGEKE
jgi:hypothetical protein